MTMHAYQVDGKKTGFVDSGQEQADCEVAGVEEYPRSGKRSTSDGKDCVQRKREKVRK
jgi:hypothetical protein